jgi:hypothetical protein
MWDAVLALAISAHRVFSQFPSVGWDVAITSDGPVLMEGNYDWGVNLVQQPGERPLGATAYPEHILSWLHVDEASGARTGLDRNRARWSHHL